MSAVDMLMRASFLSSPEIQRKRIKVPNDAIVVTDHGVKADGKRGWFYAQWNNQTTAITMYSRQDTVTVSGNIVSFPSTGTSIIGREFQEEDALGGVTLAIQGVTWGGGKPTTKIARYLAYNKVQTADNADQALNSQANTKMIWPAMEAADALKAIWIDLAGCYQFGYYTGQGLKPLVTSIATVTDAFNFAVAANLGIQFNAAGGASPSVSDVSPTRIEWGTDNTQAIFTCGLLAVQAGYSKLWFPPGHYLATSFTDNVTVTDRPGASEAIGQCHWFGATASGRFTDTQGASLLKDIIPYDAASPPLPPNGVHYGDLLSLRAATNPVVVGIGDSRGMASPNLAGQGVAISEERLRMNALMRQNKKKNFTFFDRSIPGATWWDCASKALVFPYWYTTTTAAWSTYYDTVDIGVGGSSSVVTPDVFMTDQSGANDSWNMHPLPMQVVINHLASLTGSNSGLMPDVLLVTTRPNSPLQPTTGGGSYPQAMAFHTQSEYSAMLTRSVAIRTGKPCVDYHAQAMMAMYGWDPSRCELTHVPDHAQRNVTPTTPYRIRALSRDFRIFLKIVGTGAANWANGQKIRVQLSPRPDNYVEFSTDGSGYLTYRVVTYGVDTTATVTTTAGQKTLQTSAGDGRTVSAVSYSIGKTAIDNAGTMNAITRSSGTATNFVAGDIGSAVIANGIVNAAFDGGAIRTSITDWFSGNIVLIPDCGTLGGVVTNTLIIGGLRFLPSDALAQTDVVIGANAANKITGYTDQNNVTLKNNHTVSYAGTLQNVFSGRLCIPTTTTGIQVTSDAGAQQWLEISMTGTHLQCAVQRSSDAVPIRFLSSNIERWGGKFYPFVRVTTGSLAISASGVYTDKRKHYRPLILPNEAFGPPNSSTSTDTGGDSGVHDGTPALMAIDQPCLNVAQLTA